MTGGLDHLSLLHGLLPRATFLLAAVCSVAAAAFKEVLPELARTLGGEVGSAISASGTHQESSLGRQGRNNPASARLGAG